MLGFWHDEESCISVSIKKLILINDLQNKKILLLDTIIGCIRLNEAQRTSNVAGQAKWPRAELEKRHTLGDYKLMLVPMLVIPGPCNKVDLVWSRQLISSIRYSSI